MVLTRSLGKKSEISREDLENNVFIMLTKDQFFDIILNLVNLNVAGATTKHLGRERWHGEQ